MSADAEIAVLLQRLDAVRRKERAVQVGAGVAKSALVALALLGAFFLIDWLIVSRAVESRGTERAMRAVLLVAVLGALAWTVWRHVVRRLIERLDDDTIALRVEARHPGLNGRLISSIQLHRAGHAAAGSQELIEALERDTVSFAKALDFGAIVDPRTLKRVAGWAAGFIVLALVLAVWRSDFARAMFARLFLGSGDYPTQTRIIALTPGGAAAKGSDVPIEVELDARRKLPQAAQLDVRSLSSGEQLRIAMERVDGKTGPNGGALYRCAIPKILEDSEYRAIANDARWPQWERLRVLLRPTVSSLAITYAYPAYTGKAPMTSGVADIQALVGTQVTIAIAANKALERAAIELRDGDAAAAPRTVPMELTADGMRATATFPVERDGRWRLVLADREGLPSPDPADSLIDAVEDQPPSVRIVFPGRDRTVSTKARYPIRFEARDDYGIGRVALKFRISTGEGGDADGGPVREVRVEGVTGDRAAGEVTFDLTPLQLKPDQRVSYWLEVADARAPQPNTGSSQPFTFTIADDATIRGLLDREREEQLRRIEELHRQQQESQSGVDAVIRAVGGGSPTPAPQTGGQP